ncbi:hypothetical protein Tco_1351136 [Tanacetum coccineum]
MTTLKFTDTHNMVAFLSKPAESEGFEQIMDFLNAQPIRYALTVNPTIYTSCIAQFWATVKAKTVNGEVQLQALVDGKKIIITQSTVTRDIQLKDAEGVDYLPNATIFEQLALMRYEKLSQKLTFYKAFFSPQWKFFIHTILQYLSSKTNAWNEFSSTMASAIICLATNQKFNFSKYIFESMVKNLDNLSGKFLMYPRFVQVFLNQQLDGRITHKRIYDAPSHTKKIFGNMKRVEKGFSGRITPLFLTMVVHNKKEMGEDSTIPTNPHHIPTFIQPSTSQPQKIQKPKKPKRKDTEIPQSSGPTDNVADEAVNEEMDDNLEKGSGPRRQKTMGDTIAQTRFENVSKLSNDILLARGNTLRSGEDRLKLKELMELCTNLQTRILDLETTKTTQANEIAKFGSSRRVESSEDKGLGKEDASKQGRIADIDANKDIYLVNVHTDEDMFGVNDLDGDEVIVDNVDVVKTAEETRSVVEEVTAIIKKAKLVSAAEEIVNVAATTVSTASTIPVSDAATTTTRTVIPNDEITLAKALAELKSAKPPTQGIAFKNPSELITTTPTLTTTTVAIIITVDSTRPKVKGIVIHEQEQAPTPIVSSQQPSQVKVQDKGKGKMDEPKTMKKMSKKDLLGLDEELAFKLQAEEEEESLAKVKANYQLAQRLQAQEQEELTDEEKARLFVQFLEQRRKYFATKRAEEKRNRPPTRSQQRIIMCTYLKNMEVWKPKSLKNKSFANIQELFEKAMKREESSKKAEGEIAQESSSKRAGEELEQESSKKQKVEEDKESEELRQCLEIVPDDGDDVTIDATPLSIKSPTIVD